jgi:UDP-2,4-diacetamido-2,4,6-trideoxy-beta-L-altropyranose hydrolase
VGEIKKILIRVDASNKIGTGHVMRCLTLAQELKNQGASCLFLCRALPGNLIGRIEKLGFPVRKVNGLKDDGSISGIYDTNFTSFHDARNCTKIVHEHGSELLILDHYYLGITWEKYLKKSVRKLMVIDDLANRKHCADILLDQTHGALKSTYEKLVPLDCNLLLGSKFTLLRPSFRSIRPSALKRRKAFDGVKNLLISMGGVDHTGITLNLLKGLIKANLNFEPNINIILSQKSPFYKRVQQMCKNYKGKATIFPFVENIEQFLCVADVVIGAGGTSAWERCCLGLPSIVVVLADNQKIVSKNLCKAGVIYIIKDNESLSKSLENKLSTLNNNINHYKEMSIKAASITDGVGVKLVVKAMEV